MLYNLFQKKLRSCLYVCSGGLGLFSSYNIYQGNERFYESFLIPGLFNLDPETAHRFGVLVSKYKILPIKKYLDSPNIVSTDDNNLVFNIIVVYIIWNLLVSTSPAAQLGLAVVRNKRGWSINRTAACKWSVDTVISLSLYLSIHICIWLLLFILTPN